MNELLLELFSEEIPARMQEKAADDIKLKVQMELSKRNIAFSEAQAFVTPRRIALAINGLPDVQEDVAEERKGPRLGAPDKALEGFLRSTGLEKNQLEERSTPKGDFYFAVIHKKGRNVAEVLTEIIQETIHNFTWPKSMRWGNSSVRWVRPLHNILCIFKGEVLPVKFAHIDANNLSYGHRFLAPESFTVTDFSDYKSKLQTANVVLDTAERRRIIKEEADKQAAALGITVVPDEKLLDEVAGLVEWPVVLLGNIDQQFMHLPPEVLATSMRSHQKYFSLQTKEGLLAPFFITVANIESGDDGKRIISGNERVLRARLEDAKFFWEKDQRWQLDTRINDLKKVIFHAKLGSVYDKVERIRALAKFLSVWVPHANLLKVERAASLMKADLTTDMVGEFPELQGVMGAYYAEKSEEDNEVVIAIREHYSPQGPNDYCPKHPVSVAVSLADKIDSLVGLFVADEKPTGSKDPYALRRAALGVIRIILENEQRIPLKLLFERALSLYPKSVIKPEKGFGGEKVKVKSKRVVNELLDFFADRLKVVLKDQNIRHDLISAVFDGGTEDDIHRLVMRTKALDSFLHSEDGANMLAAYKRAANIVRIEEKKDDTSYTKDPNKDLLVQDEEKVLFDALDEVKTDIQKALKEDDFSEAFALVARLRKPVDMFFDEVTVNCDNKNVRINRLMLLSQIRSFLNQVANFTLIEG